MFFLGILGLYLQIEKFNLIIFFGAFLFILGPIYFYWEGFRKKIVVTESKLSLVVGGKDYVSINYKDIGRVLLSPSLLSPSIDIQDKNGHPTISLSDYFPNNQEVQKFVDWLKTKNPNIKDEVNWDSFFIKHTRM